MNLKQIWTMKVCLFFFKTSIVSICAFEIRFFFFFGSSPHHHIIEFSDLGSNETPNDALSEPIETSVISIDTEMIIVQPPEMDQVENDASQNRNEAQANIEIIDPIVESSTDAEVTPSRKKRKRYFISDANMSEHESIAQLTFGVKINLNYKFACVCVWKGKTLFVFFCFIA